jgi:hypothetical protein
LKFIPLPPYLLLKKSGKIINKIPCEAAFPRNGTLQMVERVSEDILHLR